MNSTSVAIAVVLVVIVAIGGVYLVQRQAAQERARPRSGGELVGSGVGDLVAGVIALAGAEGDGGGE